MRRDALWMYCAIRFVMIILAGVARMSFSQKASLGCIECVG